MRCDLCGKFRKSCDVWIVMGEYDEEWTECRLCMSESDAETELKEKK